MKRSIFASILTSIFYLYFISTIIFVPYYNWTYAKENGFIKWLVFGELIATGKGIVWPYFMFFDKSDKANLTHLNNSINLANEGTTIVNKNTPFSISNDNQIGQVIDFQRRALREGKKVNINKLNKHHPNFGNFYRDYFLEGLKLNIIGYDSSRDDSFIKGQLLLDTWGKWYTANFDNIKKGNGIEVTVNHEISPSITEEPKFTSSELERYSRVLRKAEEEILDNQDIELLRGVFLEYTTRTNQKLTEEEYNNFIGVIKLVNDYIYELGSSLLYSWDQKKVITSKKFDDLYKTMQMLQIRKSEKLKEDIETLKAASLNQNYTVDGFGQKYEFGRDVILDHMKQNELSNSNMEKIQLMMKEFIK